MIGEEIMITPVLYENKVNIKPYFPPGGWNYLLTGLQIQSEH